MKHTLLETSCNFSVFSALLCGETAAVSEEGADVLVNCDGPRSLCHLLFLS